MRTRPRGDARSRVAQHPADAAETAQAPGAETQEPPADTEELRGLVGSSPAMRQLFATIAKIARYRTHVLVLGESGTGKELIARALHARGPRRRNVFVPLNCAALGRELLESELFGHERGSFTGAAVRKKGLFELADGGTLFLDEIAELDPGLQAKLLRALERHEFRRVGGTSKVRVDLSLVAATNSDLQAAIASGRFREDLYYRLKIVTVVVPPLRERKEDIPALVAHFIDDFNRRHGGHIRGIDPRALDRFMDWDWPGNVRELRNAVESAAILATGDLLCPGGPGAPAAAAPRPAPRSAAPPADGFLRIPADATLARAERMIIEERLQRLGSREEVARSLGIGLRTLYTRLGDYRSAGAPPPDAASGTPGRSRPA